MTNCKNCGAPLDGSGTCPYCGTRYESSEGHVLYGPGDKAVLKIADGIEMPVIIERVDIEPLFVNDLSRTPDGRLSRGSTVMQYRIVCVSND